MAEPGRYWRNNVGGSLNLIEAAIDAGCLDFVFSSTCATYGDRDGEVLDEDTPQAPLNAYGASKRAIEDMLADFGASHKLRSVIFRYFNVAGADPDGEVGEFHRPETHLIPLILDAAFAEYRPIAVLHFAALSQVGEAMAEPGKYWRNNVSGSLNLIEAAIDAGCLDFVFSSTCAT